MARLFGGAVSDPGAPHVVNRIRREIVADHIHGAGLNEVGFIFREIEILRDALFDRIDPPTSRLAWPVALEFLIALRRLAATLASCALTLGQPLTR